MFQIRVCRVVALCATVALPAIACAQAAPWRNDWTTTAVPSLQNAGIYDATPQSPVAFSADGEFLLRAPSLYLDDQLVRFDTGGNVRWRVNLGNIGGTSDAQNGAMLGNADGSAYVAAQYGIALVKIDPAGNITWSESFDPLYLAATPQGVVAQDCNAVAAFDGASGQLLWEHAIGSSNYCAGNGVVTDATGAAYASFNHAVGSAYDTHVMKFDANGALLWDVATTAGIRRVVGVSGNRVYVQEPSGSSALSTADGSVQWSVAGGAVGLGGSPAELLVTSSAGLERLNAADGSVRWSQAGVTGGLSPLFCSAGNKAMDGTSRIDLDTGAIDFTANLPGTDAYGNSVAYFTVMCSSDGTSTFAGASYNWTANAAPVLQRVDNGGALLATVPIAAGTRGVLADNNVVVDANSVVSVALDTDATGLMTAHVRSVDRGNGSTLWQTDLAPPGFIASSYWSSDGLAAAGGTVAVTLAQGEATQNGPNEGVWVYALDPASGAVRWSKYLYLVGDPNLYQLGTVAGAPLLDAQGNVIVSYTTEMYEYHAVPLPGQHTQSSVVKLSGTDGSILWQHDEVFRSGLGPDYQLYGAPPIFLLGSDVLVTGGFAAPNDNDSVIKLSSADGSVLWRSNVFSTGTQAGYVGNIVVADDGNPIAFSGSWAKLDAQTGATLWLNDATFTCGNICGNGGGSVVLPDGSQFAGGENYSRPEIIFWPGHAGASVQTWLFDQQDTHLRQGWISTLNRDANGAIWARLQRNYRYYGQRIAYLVQFDPASGTLVTQQALYSNDNEPLLPWVSPQPLTAPENGRLLATEFSNAPPAPNTTGLALIDTTIQANGDLSLTFTADRNGVKAGDVVGFHLRVNYSGDAAVTGARLIADFPWPGKASGVVCTTQSASNCSFDPRAGTLLATFDIQPGGQVDVTGSIVAIANASTAPFSAIVVGPTALNELNPVDNSSWATVEASIFRDGFE